MLQARLHKVSGRMPFHPEQERHDALLAAIDKAAHRIATALTEGFKHMADAQTQALADLSQAVTNIGTAITAEIAALQAALAANVPPVNDSPAIETAVTNLNNLAASLTASIPPAAPVTPPTTPAP